MLTDVKRMVYNLTPPDDATKRFDKDYSPSASAACKSFLKGYCENFKDPPFINITPSRIKRALKYVKTDRIL